LELAEQMLWNLPDVILYPTGGGTGLIGMWKAFNELAELKWLASAKRPRMVAVQSDGCDPIVRAFERGERFAEPFAHAKTIASGIRVPAAVGDFMILDALRASGGRAVAVEEGHLREWMAMGMQTEGLSICPETAACIGALEQLREENWIRPDEQVVIFNTGAVQKYPEAMQVELPRISDPARIDWDRIEQGVSS
jgi:threonine synthase